MAMNAEPARLSAMVLVYEPRLTCSIWQDYGGTIDLRQQEPEPGKGVTMCGQVSMLIVGKSIVVIGRKHRSKWWTVHCPCPASKRRKDGSCKHERIAMECLTPEVRKYARIERT